MIAIYACLQLKTIAHDRDAHSRLTQTRKRACSYMHVQQSRAVSLMLNSTHTHTCVHTRAQDNVASTGVSADDDMLPEYIPLGTQQAKRARVDEAPKRAPQTEGGWAHAPWCSRKYDSQAMIA